MLTFLSDVHCINSSTRAITYNDAHSETRSRKIRETKQRKKNLFGKLEQRGRREDCCSTQLKTKTLLFILKIPLPK